MTKTTTRAVDKAPEALTTLDFEELSLFWACPYCAAGKDKKCHVRGFPRELRSKPHVDRMRPLWAIWRMGYRYGVNQTLNLGVDEVAAQHAKAS